MLTSNRKISSVIPGVNMKKGKWREKNKISKLQNLMPKKKQG